MVKGKTRKNKWTNKSLLYTSGALAALAIMLATCSALNIFYIRSSVLGWWGESRVDTVTIPAEKSKFSGGSVISMNSTQEPAISINDQTNQKSVEISVYEADTNYLLKYLTHDKDSNQLNPTSDVSQLNRISNFSQDLTNGTKVSLPLAERGIYFVRIISGNIFHDAMIVRSTYGVTVKDSKNEFLFWGQSFKTKRSINSGTIKVYNLKDQIAVSSSGTFDSSGVGKAEITPGADIALAEVDGDVALIPLNMQYLNLNYNYISYSKSQPTTKYFVFTDRPLYKPGDAVNFKAIIRDDDDAMYSASTGTARVKITKSYSEESPVFDKIFPVDRGAVFGQIPLPKNVATGDYMVSVSLSTDHTTYNYESSTPIQVDFYKKPEYFLDIAAPITELIQGDTVAFTLKGLFFSGQPLSKELLNYKINASDYGDYSYYSDAGSNVDSTYRYGYWSGKDILKSTSKLDANGESKVAVATKGQITDGKSKIFGIEVSLADKTQPSTFARKNVLVYPGEFGIYRTDNSYSTTVNSPVSLPVILAKHIGNGTVSGIKLIVRIHRETWIPYQEPDKKYTSFRKDSEDYPMTSTISDSNGKASINFTPNKSGSYTIGVSTQDARGNNVTNSFYYYARKEGEPIYTENSSEQNLTLSIDKEKYLPTDTVQLAITSKIPDRDVFLSFQRKYVHRYQVVHLNGTSANVELPLQDSDLPNLYLEALSFNLNDLNNSRIKIPLNTAVKKVMVKVLPDRQSYGPGDTVSVTVQTTDYRGTPIAAETALWSVDKAIFELSTSTLGDIHSTFWSERYDATRTDHSLEGIISDPFGGGGGCFAKGTKVLMANGQTRNIEDIKAGDKILTRVSPTDKQLIAAQVTATHIAKDTDLIILNSNLYVTPDHIVAVNTSWKPAGSITIGDTLVHSDGSTEIVNSIEYQASTQDVYNLEVEKYHTFFANNIWVHNQKGDGGSVRSVFKDTAYWNPRIYTDSTGKAKVSFKLPDNLTTWVVAAVSNTDDAKVGQSTAEIRVTKDIVVRPIVPNILRVGDKAVLAAFVENFTDAPQTVDVGLSFDSGSLTKAMYPEQTLLANERKEFFWEVSPDKENLKSKLTFSAIQKNNAELSDTIISEIPVQAFSFLEKTGQIANSPGKLTPVLGKDLDVSKSKLTLSLSPSLVGTVPSGAKYLIDYPYGCVEQTTSRFVPAVIAKSNPALFKDALEGKDIDDILAKGVTRLEMLQLANGGWSWWYDSKPDYFVTGYVIEYLMKAKQLGVTVDDTMLTKAKYFLDSTGTNYYDSIIGKVVDIPYTIDQTISKTYASTVAGATKNKGELTQYNFQSQTPDIIALGVLANTLNGFTNPQTNGLNSLYASAKQQGDSLFWAAGDKKHFGSINASTAMAIHAILTAKGDTSIVTKAVRYLTQTRNNYYWSNTFATAQIIRALSDFSQYENTTNSEYGYSVLVDNKVVASGTISSPAQKIKDINIPLKDSVPQIEIKAENNGPMYATLVADQYHTDQNAKAVNHPLTVGRTYTNVTNPGYSFKPGDIVRVTIAVSGINSENNYAVVQDELPAGMVPINERFLNEQGVASREEDLYSYNPMYNSDREMTLNGIIFNVYNITAGKNKFTYKARVVSEGNFSVPPATASLMYAPEVYGRSVAETITISKDPVRVENNSTWIGLPANSQSSKIKAVVSVASVVLCLGLIIAAIKINANTTKNIWEGLKRKFRKE